MGPCSSQAFAHKHERLQGDEAAGEFADQLLAIGDGKYVSHRH